MSRSFSGSLNVLEQYFIGLTLPSSCFWSKTQPIWRSHASVYSVNRPYPSGSVRIGREIILSFKCWSAFNNSSLKGPNSLSGVFLNRFERSDGILAKLRKRHLKKLHSSKSERSSVTMAGTFSLRIASPVLVAISSRPGLKSAPNTQRDPWTKHTSRVSLLP